MLNNTQKADPEKDRHIFYHFLKINRVGSPQISYGFDHQALGHY